MNILIKEEDGLFRKGIEEIFKTLTSSTAAYTLNFSPEVTDISNNVDIVVLPLCKGEIKLCSPFLENPDCRLMIGILDENEVLPGTLPACYMGTEFIYRSDSFDRVRQVLIRGLIKMTSRNVMHHDCDCIGCLDGRMTRPQMHIMQKIIQGKSPKQMADEFGINEKTLYSRKKLLMNRFGLSTDYELINLMRKLTFRIPVRNI
ncbi:LuxR C-terminal-related transcriptional regulator [Lelliottia aquatilis]|uniref:LuxR C-terminal-related transcriptional regulator n=1 Tax=Lelliottia aquatilis TaxID=2080838 RepID=UPI00192C52F0|nr:LuxR C-terminal-related transcriptional regulator [Lelliottia aquatilis]MBL5886369.1 hypothetical protein [Lelliottia aquatilis]